MQKFRGWKSDRCFKARRSTAAESGSVENTFFKLLSQDNQTIMSLS